MDLTSIYRVLQCTDVGKVHYVGAWSGQEVRKPHGKNLPLKGYWVIRKDRARTFQGRAKG